MRPKRNSRNRTRRFYISQIQTFGEFPPPDLETLYSYSIEELIRIYNKKKPKPAGATASVMENRRGSVRFYKRRTKNTKLKLISR